MEKWSDDQLKNQTKRVESDAQLIKEGAKYVSDGGIKDPRLEVSEESIEKIKENFGNSIEYIQNKYQGNPEEKERLVELVKKLQTAGAHMHMNISLRENNNHEFNYSYSALADDKMRILIYPGKMYFMELSDIEDIDATPYGKSNRLIIKVKEGVVEKIKNFREESYGTALKNRSPYN